MLGACYQGAHLTYSRMDRLNSDAVGTTSRFSTRGSGGILGTYSIRHVRFRMAGVYLTQTKTGLPPSLLLLLVFVSERRGQVFRHLKVKSSPLCIFTRVLPTGKIQVKDKSFKIIFQANDP